jgi:hypothetical protein
VNVVLNDNTVFLSFILTEKKNFGASPRGKGRSPDERLLKNPPGPTTRISNYQKNQAHHG